jgi:hypothetical protein
MPLLYPDKAPNGVVADLVWHSVMRVDSVGRQHPHGILCIGLGVDGKGQVYLFTQRGQTELITPLDWEAAAMLSIAASEAATEADTRVNGARPRPDGFCEATPVGKLWPVCARRPHDRQTAHETADYVWFEGAKEARLKEAGMRGMVMG